MKVCINFVYFTTKSYFMIRTIRMLYVHSHHNLWFEFKFVLSVLFSLVHHNLCVMQFVSSFSLVSFNCF